MQDLVEQSLARRSRLVVTHPSRTLPNNIELKSTAFLSFDKSSKNQLLLDISTRIDSEGLRPEDGPRWQQPLDGSITLKSSDPQTPWGARADLVESLPENAGRYRIQLRDFFDLKARPARDLSGQSALTLLVLETSDSQDLINTSSDDSQLPHAPLGLLPVVDFCKPWITVESYKPFLKGTLFSHIQLWDGPRLLFADAWAWVRETFAWQDSQGVTYRARMQLYTKLSSSTTAPPSSSIRKDRREASTFGTIKVHKDTLLTQLWKITNKAKPAVWILTDTLRWRSTSVEYDNPSRCLSLKTEELPPNSLADQCFTLGSPVTLTFDLGGAAWSGTAEVIGNLQDSIRLAWPFSFYTWNRRRSSRLVLDYSERPATPRMSRHSASNELIIRDISLGGFGIETPQAIQSNSGEDTRYTREHQSNGAPWRLRLDKHLWDIAPDVLEVVAPESNASSQQKHSGLRVRLPQRLPPKLRELLLVRRYQDIRSYQDADHEALIELYEKYLISGHIKRNFPPNTREVFRKLSLSKDLGSIYLHKSQDGNRSGSSMVLRAWEQSWCLQHFGVVGHDTWRVSGDMFNVLVDHILSHETGHFMVFFVRKNHNKFDRVYRQIQSCFHSATSFHRVAARLWIVNPNTKDRNFDVTRRGDDIEEIDAAQIESSAVAFWGALASRALSFSAQKTKINNLRNIYSRAGLERSREFFSIQTPNRCKVCLVREHTTPGLNLTWLLNAWWLLPVSDEGDFASCLNEALRVVMSAGPINASQEQYLITPPNIDIPKRSSLYKDVHCEELYIFMADRAGMMRFRDLRSRRQNFSRVTLPETKKAAMRPL